MLPFADFFVSRKNWNRSFSAFLRERRAGTRWGRQSMSLYRLSCIKAFRARTRAISQSLRFRGCQLLCAGRRGGESDRVHSICEQAKPNQGWTLRLSSIFDVLAAREYKSCGDVIGKIFYVCFGFVPIYVPVSWPSGNSFNASQGQNCIDAAHYLAHEQAQAAAAASRPHFSEGN